MDERAAFGPLFLVSTRSSERKEGALSSHDELIGDTLAMVNVVRQAFGKEELNELPDARPGAAADCLFYRALADVGVERVGGSAMTFDSERTASVVASLWGTDAHGKGVVNPPQFEEVISAFDGDQFPHYSLPR